MDVWRRKHRDLILDTIENSNDERASGDKKSREFRLFGKTASALWEKVDDETKRKYQKKADAINAGEISAKEKREYVH